MVSGAALWLSFPNFSFYLLAWIGLIPYLDFILRTRSWGRLLLGHWILAGIYFGGVLYWLPRVLVVFGGLSWWLALPIFLLMLAAMGFLILPFTVLTRLVARRSAKLALLCAPGFWLITELTRNYFALNGFPWGAVGYSQYPFTWLIQMVDLGGVYLLSWLIVSGNCALLALIRYKAYRQAAAFALLIAVFNAYGAYRLYFWTPPQGKSIQVAVVQGNIALSRDLKHYAEKYFTTLPRYYRRAADEGADWVVFPEAQNPYFFGHDFYFTSFWQRQVSQTQIPLLLNSTTWGEDGDDRYFNSAVLLSSSGDEVYRYHKIHLVPFGEYVPLQEWLRFLSPLVEEVGGFTPGNRLELGRVQQIPFATLVCYEGIFPEISRQFSTLGAEILVNLTNDAWYGRTAAPYQHLEIAAFRAVENRKPLIRAANSGFSAFISPFGKIEQRTRLFEETMVSRQVTGVPYRTIYSRLGEAPSLALIIVSLVLPFMGGKKRRRRRNVAG